MSSLPSPDYKKTLDYDDGTNADIIETVHKRFPRAVEQTKNFAPKFKGESARATAYNIWKFLKEHITYTKDSKDEQLIRLPSRFIKDQAGDCKSYALTAAALLANNRMPVKFRYANYRYGTIPSHIYTVTADENGKEIIVDGVWKYFDSEKKPTYKFDRLMKVYTLSGTDDGINASLLSRLRRKARRRAEQASRGRGGASFSQADEAAWRTWFQKYMGRHSAQVNLLKQRQPQRYNVLIQRLRQRFLHARRVSRKRYVGDIGEIINGIDEDMQGIHAGFFKKIGKGLKKLSLKKLGKGLKKIGLAIPRRAYRTMVALNIGGMAVKLKRVFDKDPQGIKNKWEGVGGKVSELRKSVKAGYNRWARKHKKGPMTGIYGCDVGDIYREAVSMGLCGEDDSIGIAPAAIMATALPIIKALLPLLKKNGEDPSKSEDQESPVDKVVSMATDAVEKYNETRPQGAQELTTENPEDPEHEKEFAEQPGADDTPEVEKTSFNFGKALPWILGGGALLFFLTGKRRAA